MLKICYLEIRLFIQKRPAKIKPRQVGCCGLLEKDRNGHTKKVNEYQYVLVKIVRNKRFGGGGHKCAPILNRVDIFHPSPNHLPSFSKICFDSNCNILLNLTTINYFVGSNLSFGAINSA